MQWKGLEPIADRAGYGLCVDELVVECAGGQWHLLRQASRQLQGDQHPLSARLERDLVAIARARELDGCGRPECAATAPPRVAVEIVQNRAAPITLCGRGRRTLETHV